MTLTIDSINIFDLVNMIDIQKHFVCNHSYFQVLHLLNIILNSG